MKNKNIENPYLTPGRKAVLDLLHTQAEILDTIFLGADVPGLGEIQRACREYGVRFRKVPKGDLDRLCPGNHQGVVARVRSRQFMDLEQLLEKGADTTFSLILALDQVQDPGNVGTLARTLHALDGIGLLFPKDRVAFLGQTASKAAAGALDRLPLCQVVNLARALDTCAKAGWVIYGASAAPESTPLFTASLTLPAVLVLGNEDKGLRPNIGKRCAQNLKIPIRADVDSLNVAQAGAMIMTEMLRQTRFK